MELLRLLDRGAVVGGAAGRGSLRPLHAALLQAAQVGPVGVHAHYVTIYRWHCYRHYNEH